MGNHRCIWTFLENANSISQKEKNEKVIQFFINNFDVDLDKA